MEEYVSIKKAVDYSGKSESTIKRLIKRVKDSNQKTFRCGKIFNYARLNNGVEKIFIHVEFLNDEFGLKKSTSSSDRVNDMVNESVLNLLEKQLNVKDSQLEEKDRQINELLERQRETNILLERANQRIDLIEKMFNKSNERKFISSEEDIDDVESDESASSISFDGFDSVNELVNDIVEINSRSSSRIELKEEKDIESSFEVTDDHLKMENKKESFLDWLNRNR